MDITPPKPAAGAAVLPPTDTGPAAPAVLPSTNSDSGRLPSANPSQSRADSRTTPVAGDADGGVPSAPQPLGEHDGEEPMSGRTRTLESGSKKGTTRPAEPLTVHVAPPADGDDQPANQQPVQPEKPVEATQPSKVHTPKAPKKHGPALAITGVVLGMLLLAGLAILIYLNS